MAILDSYVPTIDVDATFGSGGSQYLGQSCNPSTGTLKTIQIPLKRVISEEQAGAANVIVYVYAHSGTFGTNGIPTGSPLASCNPVPLATFPVQYNDWYSFVLPTPLSVVSGTNYVVVAGLDLTLGGSPMAWGRTTSGTDDGNGCFANAALSFTSTSTDFAFRLLDTEVFTVNTSGVFGGTLRPSIFTPGHAR
jgi:hypothetical protein